MWIELFIGECDRSTASIECSLHTHTHRHTDIETYRHTDRQTAIDVSFSGLSAFLVSQI